MNLSLKVGDEMGPDWWWCRLDETEREEEEEETERRDVGPTSTNSIRTEKREAKDHDSYCGGEILGRMLRLAWLLLGPLLPSSSRLPKPKGGRAQSTVLLFCLVYQRLYLFILLLLIFFMTGIGLAVWHLQIYLETLTKSF